MKPTASLSQRTRARTCVAQPRGRKSSGSPSWRRAGRASRPPSECCGTSEEPALQTLTAPAAHRIVRNKPNRRTIMDWKDCSAVESRPDKLSGAWVFQGTRVPVEALFENLLGGATLREFTEWFQGWSWIRSRRSSGTRSGR